MTRRAWNVSFVVSAIVHKTCRFVQVQVNMVYVVAAYADTLQRHLQLVTCRALCVQNPSAPPCCHQCRFRTVYRHGTSCAFKSDVTLRTTIPSCHWRRPWVLLLTHHSCRIPLLLILLVKWLSPRLLLPKRPGVVNVELRALLPNKVSPVDVFVARDVVWNSVSIVDATGTRATAAPHLRMIMTATTTATRRIGNSSIYKLGRNQPPTFPTTLVEHHHSDPFLQQRHVPMHVDYNHYFYYTAGREQKQLSTTKPMAPISADARATTEGDKVVACPD